MSNTRFHRVTIHEKQKTIFCVFNMVKLVRIHMSTRRNFCKCNKTLPYTRKIPLCTIKFAQILNRVKCIFRSTHLRPLSFDYTRGSSLVDPVLPPPGEVRPVHRVPAGGGVSTKVGPRVCQKWNQIIIPARRSSDFHRTEK